MLSTEINSDWFLGRKLVQEAQVAQLQHEGGTVSVKSSTLQQQGDKNFEVSRNLCNV